MSTPLHPFVLRQYDFVISKRSSISSFSSILVDIFPLSLKQVALKELQASMAVNLFILMRCVNMERRGILMRHTAI